MLLDSFKMCGELNFGLEKKEYSKSQSQYLSSQLLIFLCSPNTQKIWPCSSSFAIPSLCLLWKCQAKYREGNGCGRSMAINSSCSIVSGNSFVSHSFLFWLLWDAIFPAPVQSFLFFSPSFLEIHFCYICLYFICDLVLVNAYFTPVKLYK